MGGGIGLGGGGMSMMPNHGQNLNTMAKEEGQKDETYFKGQIHKILSLGDPSTGMPTHQAFEICRERNIGPITMEQVKKYIDMLADEGNVYSTIDEDHFLPC